MPEVMAAAERMAHTRLGEVALDLELDLLMELGAYDPDAPVSIPPSFCAHEWMVVGCIELSGRDHLELACLCGATDFVPNHPMEARRNLPR